MSEFVMVEREFLDRLEQALLIGLHESSPTVKELRAVLAQEAGKCEPVAEIISKYGDPEAFGERELIAVTDISKFPYGTRLYTSPPAPVSVALSDDLVLEAMRPAIYRADGGYVFDTAKDDVIAAGRALLDKVKELNQ